MPGRVLGSFTIKHIAGLLVGLGCAGTLAGGVGVPLIIVGVTLFGISTIVSAAARIEEGPGALAKHLCMAVLVGAAGFSSPFIAFIPTNLLGLPDVVDGVALGAAAFAFCSSILIDMNSSCRQKHKEIDQYRDSDQRTWVPQQSQRDHAATVISFSLRHPTDKVKSDINQIIHNNLAKLTSQEGLMIGENLFTLSQASADYFRARLHRDQEQGDEWYAEKIAHNCGYRYDLIRLEPAPHFLSRGYSSPPISEFVRGRDLLNLMTEIG